MKNYFRLFWIAALIIGLVSCNEKGEEPTPEPPQPNVAAETMAALWETSPLDADLTLRRELFATIQSYADACASSTFSSFLAADDRLAASLVRSEPVLTCYDAAFDRVLNGLRDGKPAAGEVHIWMLYNMGYVIQTPSGCFGVDIYHRRAAELVPYLDFYASTHVHQDHKSLPLIDAMLESGKPVVTNYLERPGYAYTSETAKDYTIGNFALHTFITNHNNGSTNVPVTVFQIDCGADTDHFVLLHSGDSNFQPEQFDVTEEIDLYVLRYAPNELTENNVLGKLFTPKYALLSHILELSHADPSTSRWTLEQGLNRASKLDCAHSCMPFWGERLIWKNHKLE